MRSNIGPVFSLVLLTVLDFALYQSPELKGVTQILVFTLQLWKTVKKFLSFRYLKSYRILVPKVFSLLILILIGLLILTNSTNQGVNPEPFTLVSQRGIAFTILTLFALEIIKVIIDIILMIYDLGHRFGLGLLGYPQDIRPVLEYIHMTENDFQEFLKFQKKMEKYMSDRSIAFQSILGDLDKLSGIEQKQSKQLTFAEDPQIINYSEDQAIKQATTNKLKTEMPVITSTKSILKKRVTSPGIEANVLNSKFVSEQE